MNTIPTDTQTAQLSKAGLEDVVACSSSICDIDGVNGRLVYRGYDVVELAELSTFEEVAYLLWYGRMPGKIRIRSFPGRLHRQHEIAY